MLGWYHRDHLVDPATFSGHVGFSWQQLSPCPVWQAFASLTLWSGRTRQQQTSWLLSFTSSPMHFACGASAAIVCHLVIGYVIVEVASLSGGYEMIWRMNVGSVRAEMWDSNQIHSKGGSVKSQWVDINVLYFCYYTRYLMLLHVDFLFWKDRLMRDMAQGASLSSSSSHCGFTLFATWHVQGLCFYRRLPLFTIFSISFMFQAPWTLVHLRWFESDTTRKILNLASLIRTFHWIPSASPSSRPGAPELPTQGLICGMPPLPKQNFRNGGCLSYEGKLRHVWSFFGWTSVTSQWNDQKSPKYDDAANDPKFIIWVCLKNRMPPKSSGFLSHIPPWANSTIKGCEVLNRIHPNIKLYSLYSYTCYTFLRNIHDIFYFP